MPEELPGSRDTWRASYRGIIPDAHLTRYPTSKRAALARTIPLVRPDVFMYVATDDEAASSALQAVDPNAAATDLQGELYALYLLQNYQRQGIGRELTRTVAHHLAKQGILHAGLGTAQNPSRKFYEALGANTCTKSPSIGSEN